MPHAARHVPGARRYTPHACTNSIPGLQVLQGQYNQYFLVTASEGALALSISSTCLSDDTLCLNAEQEPVSLAGAPDMHMSELFRPPCTLSPIKTASSGARHHTSDSQQGSSTGTGTNRNHSSATRFSR